jgi:hypothetical protein
MPFILEASRFVGSAAPAIRTVTALVVQVVYTGRTIHA